MKKYKILPTFGNGSSFDKQFHNAIVTESGIAGASKKTVGVNVTGSGLLFVEPEHLEEIAA